MAIQMTRQEFESRYGREPFADIVKPLAIAAPEGKERGIFETVAKRPLERLILEPARRTGEAIGSLALSPFLNEEQKTRMTQATQEDASINVPFLGEFKTRGVQSAKQLVGESLETAGYLAPVGGMAKRLAPLLGRVGAASAAGATAGYSFDVGAKLQAGASTSDALKPGVATAAGAIIPLLGAVIGKLPKRLEEVNLRMTPTEKANFAKQGKDVAQWVANKKITGSPEVRFQKVDSIYDGLERQVQRVVDTSTITYPKQSIIEQLQRIPSKYLDNLDEYSGVVAKVTRMIRTLQETRGDSISASALNKMKRAEWKNAYNKQGSAVINEVSDEAGRIFKEILDDSVSGLKSLNKEYGNAIAARKILFKAIGRAQTGLIGKLLGTAAGAGVGGSLGGGVGAAGGAVIGEQVASKVLGTATRSRAGAAIQGVSDILGRIPIDKAGNLQITPKALMLLLQDAFPPRIEAEESLPTTSSLPDPTKETAIRQGFEMGMETSGGAAGITKAVASFFRKQPPYGLLKDMAKFIDQVRIGKTPKGEMGVPQFEANVRDAVAKFGINPNQTNAKLVKLFEEILDKAKFGR